MHKRYKIGSGQKIKNVKSEGIVRNYYSGEILPADYIPPESYIKQGIVEEIDNKSEKRFKGEK